MIRDRRSIFRPRSERDGSTMEKIAGSTEVEAIISYRAWEMNNRMSPLQPLLD